MHLNIVMFDRLRLIGSWYKNDTGETALYPQNWSQLGPRIMLLRYWEMKLRFISLEIYKILILSCITLISKIQWFSNCIVFIFMKHWMRSVFTTIHKIQCTRNEWIYSPRARYRQGSKVQIGHPALRMRSGNRRRWFLKPFESVAHSMQPVVCL